jgi:prokaryotic ubiquitin-like protein Pup
MSEQAKVHSSRGDREAQQKAEMADLAERDAAQVSDDDLLDEIDAVLEENAQEFLSRFRQKGGE